MPPDADGWNPNKATLHAVDTVEAERPGRVSPRSAHGELKARVPIYGKLRSSTRRASRPTRASTWATSGCTAASLPAARRRRPSGPSRALAKKPSPGPAGGPYHQRLPHLQGRHREGRSRQPVDPKPETGQDRVSAFSTRRTARSTSSWFPANGRPPARRSATCSAISVHDGQVEVILQCAAAAVLRHGPGRHVPPRGGRLVRVELPQGLPGHLAASGAGGQPGRDLQHLLERPGGDGGHPGHAAGRFLPRLHVPAGHEPDLRRRPVRVDYPHPHPGEP